MSRGLGDVYKRQIQGNEENLDEIILHDNGYITEGAVSNVFCVKNKKVLTPSLQNNILPGVTRSVIIDIVKKLNIPLAESRISVEDLKNADEVWITNTTKGILLVSEIDQIKVFREDMIFKEVQEKFIQETLA